MYLEDHVEVRNPLVYWRELLQEWVFLVHRIYRISGKRTAVYAEKERANTGLVAAAATRNGWVALEECRTQKLDRLVKKHTYSGRCDLLLWRDRRYHEIEAKFGRFRFGSENFNWIDKIYDRVVKDSQRSTPANYKSDKKIALAYIVPVISPNRIEITNPMEVSDWLRSFTKDLRSRYSPTLMAYAFPGQVTLEGSPNLGLGVILMGTVVSSAKK